MNCATKNVERDSSLQTNRWRNELRRRWQTAWRPMLLALFCGLGASSAHAGMGGGKMLKVITKDVGGITHFYVQNMEAADVTATFSLQMTNLNCSAHFPYTTTFPGSQTTEAFTLSPVEAGIPWSFNYANSFTIGNNTAVHDDTYIYSLPYMAGQSFRVTQGYHGKYSHIGPDEYATDWKMPVGTPVHAARGGVVVKSKDDSDQGGPDRKFENCANCVLIQHVDGTIGIYAHLMKGGSRVKVGDKVNPGDLIALSGNTGFTSGPHLHFSVFKTKSGAERQSLPVRFKTGNEGVVTLVSGQNYRSAPNEVQEAKVRVPLTVKEDKKKS